MGMIETIAAKPSLRDVSLSQKADQAFRSIFENAPCGMLLVNAQGLITHTNERLCAMFGYSTEELAAQPIEILLPTRFRSDHVGLRDGYTQAPRPRAMGQGRDLTGLRKDGVEFPLEIGLSVIDTAEGRFNCASIIDITDRKRAELRLKEANGQLEEFTYVASHDLRSPIRGIANLIEFIREDYGDSAPATVQKNLARMDERIGAMEKLIEDLLTYARSGRRTAKIEPIVLRDLVDEVLALEPPPAHVHISVDASDESFDGTKVPLATVLRNLISNAIKHHDREEVSITITIRLVHDQCIMEVSDDGPGIPEAAQKRVFRLFQTLNASERKGVGLGLAVVQRLVTGHGGAITLLSSDDQRGSTFRVRWPRYARTDLDD
ncbi:MAG: PAS domain-containing sensor histidine kinase [Sphingobium sp.]|nr:PAS domain S-box protein [Sphingobium sp.]MCP5399705.1 PAS domain-containing sensor histidine kinase [Sphingomonas sp.]